MANREKLCETLLVDHDMSQKRRSMILQWAPDDNHVILVDLDNGTDEGHSDTMEIHDVASTVAPEHRYTPVRTAGGLIERGIHRQSEMDISISVGPHGSRFRSGQDRTIDFSDSTRFGSDSFFILHSPHQT